MKIGIDLGGSHVAIGVVDENGKIREKIEKRFSEQEKENIERAIVDTIIEHSNFFKREYEVEEIGIGMPGWLEDGKIMWSGNIGVTNFDLKEALEELKLPVKIRNDAKCAAMAEKQYGCLKGYGESLFLTLGTGIGGAVFSKGELLETEKRPGYEFGHMVIQKEGIICKCGRKGCFERYASMKVFKNELRRVLGLDETTRGEELLEKIRRNSPEKEHYEKIEKVVTEFINNLSIGLENLIWIFEPQAIGLGGSFVYFEDVLLPKLNQKLQAFNQEDRERKKIEIKPAVLGNDAGIIGAVL